MHEAQITFCLSVRDKFPEIFKNNTVLDVGSLDVNGTNRYLFTDCKYTGIDLGPGNNVDVICKAHQFNPGIQYGIVISTECFEHDEYWDKTFLHCIELTKRGGLFFFTCAGIGRGEHGTSDSHPEASPFTSHYYRNLGEEDFRAIEGWEDAFSESSFITNTACRDLYFWGIKS